MRVNGTDDRRSVVRVAGAVLSASILAVTISVLTGSAPAEAVGSSSTWFLGANSPDQVASQTTYYGVPFTPRFNGLEIPYTYPGDGGFSTSDGTSHPPTWVSQTGYTTEFSVDLPGGIITKKVVGGSPGIRVSCVNDTCAAGLASFQVTHTYTAMARSKACVDDYFDGGTGSLDDACPRQQVSGTQVRTVLPGREPADENFPPTASFTTSQSTTDPLEWTFESRSSDDRDELAELDHEWDFGDGETSSEVRPTHRFGRTGEHEVTLTVTDGGGLQAETTTAITIASGLVVNSTGDAPALDPEDRGCDTGDLVDGTPECTLRAAIEASQVQGGGEISFDVAGGGVPTIAVGTALPALAASTTVDGTTQPGSGQVELTGPATATGLALTGGTSTVQGLVISGFDDQIAVSGGSGHTITGNVLAADPAGTTGRDGTSGVAIAGATGVVVDDNVIGAVAGIRSGPTASGVQITGNAIGVGSNGATLGETRAAIALAGPGATITGNTLRGESVGALVATATATGATVADNRVGLSEGGTPYEAMGYGIRIDGAPGATVEGNTVVSPAYGAIVASGSFQAEFVGDELLLNDPDDDDLPGAVTGGGTTISGNSVAIAGSDGDELGRNGIVSWAGAADLVVTGNTVGGVSDVGIELVGGSGHRVAGNTVGSATASAHTGIAVEDARSSTIGGVGPAGNALATEYGGIAVEGTSTGARVQGNTVRAVEPGTGYVGIDLPDLDTTGATVDANVVTGGETGIGAKAPGVTIRGNRATDQIQVGIAGASLEGTIDQNVVTGAGQIGIGSLADRATVSKNTVNDGTGGIAVNGTGVTVTENRVGLAEGAATVVGNTGTGISVEGGKAVVQRNQVAGSGTVGIDVLAAADATLKGNRVWRSTALPIAVADGPDAPVLAAAVRTGSGETLRRTLVIADLPSGDAGTIEVFANSSCTGEGGGEAELLMDITRTKAADEANRIIQVKEQPGRDHFTVAYTDAGGRTSQLSNCESGDTYPDGDGDGAPDPLDGIAGFDDDPTAAVVATDGEQLLLVQVTPRDPETKFGGGQLEDVGVREDPAPGSHPAGWSLPYGALGFRITGLEPGGRTGAYLTTLTGDTAIGGDSYWKYGPPTPGAAPSWYRFTEDGTTGARLTDAAFVGGEVRRAWLLVLGDGLRGDSDGGANGTITDPGGPVLGGATDPVVPTVPTTPTTPTTNPTEPTTPTPSAPPTTGPDAAAGSGGVAAPLPSAGSLPRTGSETTTTLLLGVVLVLGGGGILLARRRTALG